MLRVDEETRDQIMRVAQQDFGGVTADQALRRLLDEHWELSCLAAVEHYRTTDPDGYADYAAELARIERELDEPVTEPYGDDR